MRETPTPSMLRSGLRRLAGLLMLALLAGAAAAQGTAALPPTVTILDGNALLLRGSARLQLAEGVRLAPQDIVETAADTRLVRIEFADGMALSLGPATRLLVEPRLAGEKGRAAQVYLLRGWFKLNAAPAPAAAPGKAAAPPRPAPLASPDMDLVAVSGSVVASVQEAALQVFVESGEATLQERLATAPAGAPQRLRSGEFLARRGDAKSAVTPRAAGDFVQQLPRSFLDTLPARAALFRDRETTPKALGEITYADVQAWLSAEPALRRPAMPRWRALTRNAAFRTPLVANMAAHPEWDRVLFPEKYRPKPAYPGAVPASR